MDTSSKIRILITGASGFVGSRLVKKLTTVGYSVWGIDILPNPFIQNSPKENNSLSLDKKYSHHQIDLTKTRVDEKIAHLLIEHQISLVIHLAALIKVGESEEYPDKYWRTNRDGTENILRGMKAAGARKIIFASTAAVYQTPEIKENDKIKNLNKYSLSENSPLDPISVYGKTKLLAEKLIQRYVKEHDFQVVVFRFFNISGGKEIHQPSVHLIPIVISRLMADKSIAVFGQDYPTPDGTCYRDYFDVSDLIEAICLAIYKWLTLKSDPIDLNSKKICNGFWKIYNLGAGQGLSVLEVISEILSAYDQFSENDSKKSKIEIQDRRSGDPPVLIANCQKVREELGWRPSKSLKEIIERTLQEMMP